MSNISVYKNVEGKMPKTQTLANWLRPIAKPKNADKLKTECATIHGTFNGAREAVNFMQHSGYAFIDVDPENNAHILNFKDLKNELIKLPEVAYCAYSFTGSGYHLIIPLQYPEKHSDQYAALVQAFADLRINIDQRCKDLTRLKIRSYDPEPYFNWDAKSFNGILEQKKQTSTFTATHEDNILIAEPYVKAIEQQQLDFAPEYDDYIELAFALAEGTGETGRALYHRCCQFSPKYDFDHAENKYTDALSKGNGKITFASFIHRCKKFSLDAVADFEQVLIE